jgi:hypothetical protein
VRKHWLVSTVVTLTIGTASPFVAGAQTPDEACTSTWSNCGVAVKHALEENPSDAKRIVELAGLWGHAFGARFDALRKQGRVERSTPDSEKIFEALNAKLNPVEIAKDKAKDALVKRYLASAAAILEWASKPVAEALKAFFNASEIASDYDELRIMNDDIQKRIAVLLSPYVVADWRQRLEGAAQEAAPQLKLP